jgi:hypothetical protein
LEATSPNIFLLHKLELEAITRILLSALSAMLVSLTQMGEESEDGTDEKDP